MVIKFNRKIIIELLTDRSYSFVLQSFSVAHKLLKEHKFPPDMFLHNDKDKRCGLYGWSHKHRPAAGNAQQSTTTMLDSFCFMLELSCLQWL